MSDLPVNVVVQGDCLEVLRTLPDNSVDSVVTDPPAGINFMNKDFDDPDTYGVEGRTTRDKFIGWLTLIMKECLRVLKPGGHALVWSIPRTSHWTATAIEDAGFEIRDSVLHCFGSGFPKSLNISKALDRMAGAERKVVKAGKGADKPLPEMTEEQIAERIGPSIMASEVGINTPAFNARIGEVTEPATEEAKKWDGWGTQLKPAYENWILARKPLAEKNVVSQVLATGTGAMNIDGSRVASADGNPSVLRRETARRTGTVPITGRSAAEAQAEGRMERRGSPEVYMENRPSEALGRWPANFVLSHSPSCRRVGTQTVEAPTINRFTDGMKPFGEGAGHPYETTGGGTEERAVYECEETCPVRKLDEQSGVLKTNPGTITEDMASMGFHGGSGSSRVVQADSGGASRFFANFTPDIDAPFIYAPKASKSDKNADLDGYEDVNKHPTVKSQQLMTFLVKLITPPGGIVLDPFAGSGSTLVAAASLGFSFIGIEKDDEYFKIATKRVNAALGRAETEAAQRGAFNSMEDMEQE